MKDKFMRYKESLQKILGLKGTESTTLQIKKKNYEITVVLIAHCLYCVNFIVGYNVIAAFYIKLSVN